MDILEIRGSIDEERDISSIAYHTDDVRKDSIFVAIKGYVTDGHKYLKQAKNKGAIFTIVEDFKDVYIPQIKVSDSRKALADISANFYKRPSKNLNIIGITGTNGKTTTSFFIDEILKKAKIPEGIIGTVLTRFNDTKIPSILTTPESLELQKYFYEMNQAGIESVVMEVSSSAQELERVKNIDFDIVTFNNFSREHIDQHGSFERYYEVKSRLIKNAKKDAFAILNGDFEKIKVLKDQTKAHVLTFSLESLNEDFGITGLDLSTGRGKYYFHINRDLSIKDGILKKESFPIELGTAGYSSVMNSVVAIIVALVMGIDISVIQKALLEFQGVERRLEIIYDEKFKILDDHFANEKNIDSTLATLEKMNYNQLHILYAIRGNRGVEVNRESTLNMVKWLKKLNPTNLFATLSRDTVTKKDEVSGKELEVYRTIIRENEYTPIIYNTLEEGINRVLDCAEEGDIVLLAGCQGMDKGAQFVKDRLLQDHLVKDVDRFIYRIDSRIC